MCELRKSCLRSVLIPVAIMWPDSRRVVRRGEGPPPGQCTYVISVKKRMQLVFWLNGSSLSYIMKGQSPVSRSVLLPKNGIEIIFFIIHNKETKVRLMF